MNHRSNTPTIDPEKAVRIALHRPIVEQEAIKPIGQAFMRYAQDKKFGFRSFLLTMAQVFYSAGMAEGIRSERNRKRNTNCVDVTSSPVVDGQTYVSVICEDEDAAQITLRKIIAKFGIRDYCHIAGNEILIQVLSPSVFHFSFNDLRNAVIGCTYLDMFNFESDSEGNLCRYWYNINREV